MGIFHAAYSFYGVHVPKDQQPSNHVWTEAERLDRLITAIGDDAKPVGHLTAGKYDRDELFLSVVPDGVHGQVDLGEWRSYPSHAYATDIPYWDRALALVIKAAGYEGLSDPGWMVVPDAS